jgi:hypothetical protein
LLSGGLFNQQLQSYSRLLPEFATATYVLPVQIITRLQDGCREADTTHAQDEKAQPQPPLLQDTNIDSYGP